MKQIIVFSSLFIIKCQSIRAGDVRSWRGIASNMALLSSRRHDYHESLSVSFTTRNSMRNLWGIRGGAAINNEHDFHQHNTCKKKKKRSKKKKKSPTQSLPTLNKFATKKKMKRKKKVLGGTAINNENEHNIHQDNNSKKTKKKRSKKKKSATQSLSTFHKDINKQKMKRKKKIRDNVSMRGVTAELQSAVNTKTIGSSIRAKKKRKTSSTAKKNRSSPPSIERINIPPKPPLSISKRRRKLSLPETKESVSNQVSSLPDLTANTQVGITKKLRKKKKKKQNFNRASPMYKDSTISTSKMSLFQYQGQDLKSDKNGGTTLSLSRSTKKKKRKRSLKKGVEIGTIPEVQNTTKNQNQSTLKGQQRKQELDSEGDEGVSSSSLRSRKKKKKRRSVARKGSDSTIDLQQNEISNKIAQAQHIINLGTLTTIENEEVNTDIIDSKNMTQNEVDIQQPSSDNEDIADQSENEQITPINTMNMTQADMDTIQPPTNNDNGDQSEDEQPTEKQVENSVEVQLVSVESLTDVEDAVTILEKDRIATREEMNCSEGEGIVTIEGIETAETHRDDALLNDSSSNIVDGAVFSDEAKIVEWPADNVDTEGSIFVSQINATPRGVDASDDQIFVEHSKDSNDMSISDVSKDDEVIVDVNGSITKDDITPKSNGEDYDVQEEGGDVVVKQNDDGDDNAIVIEEDEDGRISDSSEDADDQPSFTQRSQDSADIDIPDASDNNESIVIENTGNYPDSFDEVGVSESIEESSSVDDIGTKEDVVDEIPQPSGDDNYVLIPEEMDDAMSKSSDDGNDSGIVTREEDNYDDQISESSNKDDTPSTQVMDEGVLPNLENEEVVSEQASLIHVQNADDNDHVGICDTNGEGEVIATANLDITEAEVDDEMVQSSDEDDNAPISEESVNVVAESSEDSDRSVIVSGEEEEDDDENKISESSDKDVKEEMENVVAELRDDRDDNAIITEGEEYDDDDDDNDDHTSESSDGDNTSQVDEPGDVFGSEERVEDSDDPKFTQYSQDSGDMGIPEARDEDEVVVAVNGGNIEEDVNLYVSTNKGTTSLGSVRDCNEYTEVPSIDGEEDLSDLKVSIITWNLAEISPSEREASFLRRFASDDIESSDLILFGGQETEMTKPRRTEGRRSREMRRLMIKNFGKKYVPLALHGLGGVQLGLFCKKSILEDIEYVSVADVTCGVGNVFHNKGAIGAFVRMKARNDASVHGRDSVSMLFVACHLAAQVKKLDARNNDFWRIVSQLETQAPPGFLKPRRMQRHGSLDNEVADGKCLMDSIDKIFFCGDLNYRVDLPREQVEQSIASSIFDSSTDSKIQKKQLRELLRHDQLLRTIADNKAFPGMVEGEITFKPTFKFDKGTNSYDTSHKQRVPSWTDRVLFKPFGVRLLEYNSVQSSSSDHKPVYATFGVNLGNKSAMRDKQRKTRRKKKKLDKMPPAGRSRSRKHKKSNK